MLPRDLVDWLPTALRQGAATRDADNVPHGHRVMGVEGSEDGTTITFCVLDRFQERLLDNLRQNGQVALTIMGGSTPGSHESYQFKGCYASHEGPNDRAAALAKDWFDRMSAEMAALGFPTEACQQVKNCPFFRGVAVTMRIEQVFCQTPGPGAGAKLEGGG